MQTVNLNSNSPFVDYRINVKDKYLTFKYTNSNNQKITKINITTTMYTIISEAKTTKSINNDLLDELTPTEKAVVLVSLKKMGINIKDIDTYSGGDMQEVLQTNIELLKGEYKAGNKSKIIKQALTNNIKMLYISDYISKSDYTYNLKKLDSLHFN